MHGGMAILADFIAGGLLNTRSPRAADVYPIVTAARIFLSLIAESRPDWRRSHWCEDVTRGTSLKPACNGHKCDGHSSVPVARVRDGSLIGSAGSGGQASTMFRGPGAGLAPAQPAHVERRCGHGYDSVVLAGGHRIWRSFVPPDNQFRTAQWDGAAPDKRRERCRNCIKLSPAGSACKP